MHRPQLGIAPIPNRVETPGFEPGGCFLTPARAPLGAELALEVGRMEIERMSMIKRATALRLQTAAIILFAPVRGEFAISRRQIAEHELAAVDIARPASHDGIHPDREKWFPLRGDEPPSAIPPLCSKKSGRAKLAALLQPAKAVALERFGAPLRESACLLCASG